MRKGTASPRRAFFRITTLRFRFRFQLYLFILPPVFFSALIAGGGAPEIHVSRALSQYAHTLRGMEAYCFQAFADALEVIPTTLAENAGMNPIAIVTELRNRHALGERNAGINVRTVSVQLGDTSRSLFFSLWFEPETDWLCFKGLISNILEEDVVQPLLVSTSALELSTETVCLLLRIDDYVQAR